jgi:hypothetical protein
LILTHPLERTERMEMTVRRAKTDRKEAPDSPHHLSGWQLVAALAIIAIVIIATLLITKSSEAVMGVTIPLLIVLAWWLGRHLPRGLGE